MAFRARQGFPWYLLTHSAVMPQRVASTVPSGRNLGLPEGTLLAQGFIHSNYQNGDLDSLLTLLGAQQSLQNQMPAGVKVNG